MLVWRCCVSIYVSIWRNHHHTLLVLVSFLGKELVSLAFMVTLAKPSLGTPSMAPNPSAIWAMNLAISWFCVVVSLCCTTNVQKVSRKAKNSLDILSTFGLLSSYVLVNLSTLERSKACLPPFLLFG